MSRAARSEREATVPRQRAAPLTQLEALLARLNRAELAARYPNWRPSQQRIEPELSRDRARPDGAA